MGWVDHPADVHASALDILQDSLVGGWPPSLVVVLGQSVHRHGHPEPGNLTPCLRDRNHGAGDDERVKSHVTQARKHFTELAMTHERLSTHQRHLHGPVSLGQGDDALDGGRHHAGR